MKKIVPGIIVLIIIAIVIFVFIPKKDNSTGTSTGTQTTSTTTSTGTVTTISMTEVAKHNNASSCYTAINGSVYDVTTWINQHPGGPQAILGLCGKDGSDAFNGKHGGQPRPTTELATFKIGEVAK